MNLMLCGLFLFLCCVFSAVELATRRGYKFLCAVLLLLFVYIIAERNIFIVPDSLEYVKVYEAIQKNPKWSDTYFEGGYMFFNRIVAACGLDYRFFLGLAALLPSIVYLYAMAMLMDIKGEKRKLYCVFFSLYAVFWGFVGSGITLRVGLATPFAFLAHVLMLRKKYLRAAIVFVIAFTFHFSIVVYPLSLFLSSKTAAKFKKRDIYWMTAVFMWLMTAIGFTRAALNWCMLQVLRLISSGIAVFMRYQTYLYSFYDASSSRKNLMFMFFLFIFVKARPPRDKIYDHWLSFFAFNMIITFPLSSFVVGYRVTDISLIAALPLLVSCMSTRKFYVDIKIFLCILFTVSMLIFSLRMSNVY